VTPVFGLEFQTPAGETLYFEWNPESLARLDGELAAATPWQLDGELDWDEVELIRVLSARFDDGRLLGVAVLRPSGAEGHGDELVVGLLVDAEGNATGLSETLLSVEYDGSGLPRRAGLELYRGEGAMPLRVAADVTATDVDDGGSIERTSALLAVRLAGAAGDGRLDVIRAA
jgi:hypothetical protein